MAKRLKSVPWLAGWFALSTAAHAGPPSPSPAYPSKTDPASVRAWIAADTSLDPAQITLIAEGAVFALLPSDTAPGSDGVLVRRLREEVYSPAVAAALGGRSSTATVFFDCAHSSYSLRDPQVYPGASLQGEAKSVTPSRWLSASVVYLYDLAASVCPTGRSAPPPQVAPVDPPVSAPSPPKADDIPAAPTTVTAPAFDAGPPAEAGATPRAPPVSKIGTVWIQVGVFADRASAEQRWSGVKGKSGASSHRIEPVPASTLLRLLIGPYESQPVAAAQCASLKRQSIECFVRPR